MVDDSVALQPDTQAVAPLFKRPPLHSTGSDACASTGHAVLSADDLDRHAPRFGSVQFDQEESLPAAEM